MKNFILLLVLLFSQFTFAQNLKLPQLNPILNSQLASNDVTVVSDISATESKKLSIGELDKRWQWTATSPLLKTGSESAVLSIPLATGSVSGYLSSSDWTLFNAKQPTVSATAPVVFSSNTISIPAATTSVNGYLSSADWTTFNNKVGTSTVQTLTNKDIDGGTASNTSRITLPKDTKTNLDALTRKAGTIVYDTTSNKPYFDNGTTLTVIGSGSGGGKNYITGGDAESGTTGFATYADAAGTSPVDGTGGSPSVTWTTSNSSPLENANSFLLTKGATNRQGDGVSYAFTIDAKDQAKVLQISFSYLVSSGTFVSGTSSTASDVTVWIYDVTNAQIIQPSSYKLLSNSTTISDTFNATFQTASNSTSYRLIFHVGSTSASAYTLKIDDVKVSPSTYVYGTPVTDWASYTCSGNWTANVTYACKFRRVGDSIEIDAQLSMTGTPTPSANMSVSIPSGYSIDTSKLSGAGSTAQVIGYVYAIDTGVANYTATAVYNGGAINFIGDGSGGSLYTLTAPFTWGNTDRLTANIKLPILGFSSSIQTSDQTDTRVVSMSATRASAAVTANTTIASWTTTLDRTGAFNASTGVYTIQTPGDYFVSVTGIYPSSAGSTIPFIRKNGVAVVNGTVGTNGASYGQANGLLSGLVAGDTITITTDASLTLTGTVNLSIYRLSGPSAIAATESLNLRYKSTAGQSLTSGNTTLSFATKDYDSHGTFSSNTTFTAPISGKYSVKAKVASNTISGLSANYLRILVNGSSVSESQYAMTYATASNFTFAVSDTIKLNAGDAVTIQFQNGFGSTVTAVTTTGAVSLAIERVGN